eukprot:COSAG01_NODE_4_length_55812_cov_1344.168109_46_plen_239_part_00
MKYLKIYTFVVSPYQQNARLLVDIETKEAMLVDPGAEVERMLAVIQKEGYLLKTVFLTHAHIDHAGGVKRLLDMLKQRGDVQPELLYHSIEKQVGAHIKRYAEFSGLDPVDFDDVPEASAYLDQETHLSVGHIQGELRFVPGHSPGHLVLFFSDVELCFEGDLLEQHNFKGNVLIAGDTLFYRSIGRSDLPGGNAELLLQSIQSQLLTLPEDTLVLPGHGPQTSVGVEKRLNPFLKLK